MCQVEKRARSLWYCLLSYLEKSLDGTVDVHLWALPEWTLVTTVTLTSWHLTSCYVLLWSVSKFCSICCFDFVTIARYIHTRERSFSFWNHGLNLFMSLWQLTRLEQPRFKGHNLFSWTAFLESEKKIKGANIDGSRRSQFDSCIAAWLLRSLSSFNNSLQL